MSAATILSNGTLLVDENLRDEATEIVHAAHDRKIIHVSLTLEDGTVVDMPREMASLVSHVLHGVSRGAINVATFPPELTSTAAADVLGVSRTTLMKWVGDSILTPRRIGTHHRFVTSEVIELAMKRQTDRVAAFAALRAWEEEHEA